MESVVINIDEKKSGRFFHFAIYVTQMLQTQMKGETVNHCIKYVATHIISLKEKYGMKLMKITE